MIYVLLESIKWTDMAGDLVEITLTKIRKYSEGLLEVKRL